MADHRDVAALLQQAGHAVDVDAAQRGDLPPRDRLAVGDDGQRLERGRRQAVRHLAVGEALDVGGQVGVGLQAGAAGDAGQHEAALLALVGARQPVERLLDPLDRLLEQLGQQLGGTGSTATSRMASIVRAELRVLPLCSPLILRSRRFVAGELGQTPPAAHPGQVVAGDPRRSAGRRTSCPWPRRDPAHLAQLEEGQEADDDLDAGPAPATSSRNEATRSDSGAAIRSATASDTDTVSTVTWDRSTRGTGRSAEPRR